MLIAVIAALLLAQAADADIKASVKANYNRRVRGDKIVFAVIGGTQVRSDCDCLYRDKISIKIFPVGGYHTDTSNSRNCQHATSAEINVSRYRILLNE